MNTRDNNPCLKILTCNELLQADVWLGQQNYDSLERCHFNVSIRCHLIDVGFYHWTDRWSWVVNEKLVAWFVINSLRLLTGSNVICIIHTSALICGWNRYVVTVVLKLWHKQQWFQHNHVNFPLLDNTITTSLVNLNQLFSDNSTTLERES